VGKVYIYDYGAYYYMYKVVGMFYSLVSISLFIKLFFILNSKLHDFKDKNCNINSFSNIYKYKSNRKTMGHVNI